MQPPDDMVDSMTDMDGAGQGVDLASIYSRQSAAPAPRGINGTVEDSTSQHTIDAGLRTSDKTQNSVFFRKDANEVLVKDGPEILRAYLGN